MSNWCDVVTTIDELTKAEESRHDCSTCCGTDKHDYSYVRSNLKDNTCQNLLSWISILLPGACGLSKRKVTEVRDVKTRTTLIMMMERMWSAYEDMMSIAVQPKMCDQRRLYRKRSGRGEKSLDDRCEDEGGYPDIYRQSRYQLARSWMQLV